LLTAKWSFNKLHSVADDTMVKPDDVMFVCLNSEIAIFTHPSTA